MDILDFFLAKNAGGSGNISGLEKAIETLQDSVKNMSGDVESIIGDLSNISDNLTIVDSDKSLAVSLLINAFRQYLMEESLVCEEGTVTLTNTLSAPFNNSETSVSLTNVQPNTSYAVIAQAQTPVPGNAGELIASGKLVNGFKLAYTGSASSVTVKYIVIGGIIK